MGEAVEEKGTPKLKRPHAEAADHRSAADRRLTAATCRDQGVDIRLRIGRSNFTKCAPHPVNRRQTLAAHLTDGNRA